MSVATEPPNEHYPHLFAPFELAGKRLRNRIVHASISLHFGAERGAPDGLIDYHASRARSGAAMIVTEPIGVAAHQATSASSPGTTAWPVTWHAGRMPSSHMTAG